MLHACHDKAQVQFSGEPSSDQACPRTSESQGEVGHEGQRAHGNLRAARHVNHHTCGLALGELCGQLGSIQDVRSCKDRRSLHGGLNEHDAQLSGLRCVRVLFCEVLLYSTIKEQPQRGTHDRAPLDMGVIHEDR